GDRLVDDEWARTTARPGAVLKVPASEHPCGCNLARAGAGAGTAGKRGPGARALGVPPADSRHRAGKRTELRSHIVRQDGYVCKEIRDRGAIRQPRRIRTAEIGRDGRGIASYLTDARAGAGAGTAVKRGPGARALGVWVHRVAVRPLLDVVDDEDRVVDHVTG